MPIPRTCLPSRCSPWGRCRAIIPLLVGEGHGVSVPGDMFASVMYRRCVVADVGAARGGVSAADRTGRRCRRAVRRIPEVSWRC